jgi:hypothetical protein
MGSREEAMTMVDEPRLNDRFPIGENLSPPVIRRPIYECAEAVHVSGFVPHAVVRVFASGAELLAEVNPPFGFADVNLSRPLVLGDLLTATQTVMGIDSGPSQPAVPVEPLPESAVRTNRPDVGDRLFECGRVVPVGNLVPGCRVHVYEDAGEIASTPTASDYVSVVTPPLHAGSDVTARQVACEGSAQEIVGPDSDPVQVLAAPVPTPPPSVDAASLIPGNDAVTLRSLLVGAGVEIFDVGASIASGWLANAEANFFSVNPPLTGASSVTATQELCGRVSPPSPPETPTGELAAPTVIGPICADTRFVLLRGTVVNATVVVLRNGSVVAYGGAAPGDVVLQLGGNSSLNLGDSVTAAQYMGQTVSPSSAPVIVVGQLSEPAVEILGGHPFFLAKGSEEPIDGAVFPRGVGPGASIGIQTCCDEEAAVRVLGPDGGVIAQPSLTEVYPGYFTARWVWPTPATIIPVGRYTVITRSPCARREAVTTFYVVFDPAEVNGPDRFSFESTAVWFGAGKESVSGLHYYLHPSDSRVFLRALLAANGLTDSFAAAIEVARAEEALFGYSLAYHTQDVVDLITNFTDAQCADDACCLVALLRAIGIPAHPVTADAGLETGAANWTFDTWVEFLAPDGAGIVDWRIFHPHEYPGMQPESRQQFGTTRGVAVKSFNDVIVMAAEGWVTADLDDGAIDVSYGRNACQEPVQNLVLAPWVDELCEQGYWPVAHWDCTGVRIDGLVAGEGFRFDPLALDFGGVLSGTADVSNPGPERRFGTLTVELVGSRIDSKAPSDVTYAETSARAAIDPADTITVPFRFDLPPTLPPYHELVLRVRLDHRVALQRAVRLPARVDGRIDLPSRLALGERSVLHVRVHNPGEATAHGVQVRLAVPYALAATEQTTWDLGDLAPGEARDASVALTAAAPLTSGSVHVAITSAMGGSTVLRHHVEIVELPAVEPAGPGAQAPT